jgi:hypothetical protein
MTVSQLDTWFTMPAAFLDDDILITPVTTDCHIRFSHTVFRIGGSNASFVANLRSTRRHGKYRQTCQGSCQGQPAPFWPDLPAEGEPDDERYSNSARRRYRPKSSQDAMVAQVTSNRTSLRG